MKKGIRAAKPQGQKGERILTDGETRTPSASAQKSKSKAASVLEAVLGAVAGGAKPMLGNRPAKPARTNLGGNTPPEKPQAKPQLPPARAPRERPMAIGERPVQPKTLAKMKKMR